MIRVVGLDLSLTSTGMALVEGGRLTEVGNIKSSGKKGATYAQSLDRIQEIAKDVLLFVARPVHPDLVVIESPSYGSRFGSAHERAGLWWEVFHVVSNKLGIPVATVAPPTRAKYITGDGRAGKDVVLAHAIEAYVRDRGPRITNDDIADAVGLAAMGSRWLGEPVEVHSLPERNLEAMNGAKWPN